MNNKINEILSELYQIDPKMKKDEKQIKKIIENLISLKSNVKIDDKFHDELRIKLQQVGNRGKISLFKRTKTRLILAAIVSMTALAIVFIPMYKNSYQMESESKSDMRLYKVSEESAPVLPMVATDSRSDGFIMEENWNTEEYDRIVENGFINSMNNPLSTFSIDVDTASYANVRRFLRKGSLPYADAVRIEELINYFHYNYPEPTGEHPFSINTEVSRAPWNKENLLVKIGLQGETISFDELPASNLVFLLDVSGSMNDSNKLPLLKSALKLVVNNMREQDSIAIAVYAGAAGTVLEPTSGTNKNRILEALENLEAGGSTAGAEGIKLAYEKAQENFKTHGNNRIILATDGDFNVGVSSNAELERLIEKKRESGIYLTVLGFGMGNYKDSKMEILADKGNGNYAYIDSILEARKVLVEEMGGTFYTIAKDVKIQIEFNPALIESYRLIGYENRVMANEDFKDDTKDAGELGAGHSVTALYELIPAGRTNQESDLKYQSSEINDKALTSDELMTVKFRYKRPDSGISSLLELVVNNNIVDFESTSNDFRFAASVAQWGMLLRDSQYLGSTTFEQVIQNAADSKGKDENGYRSEFINLVKLSRDLSVE